MGMSDEERLKENERGAIVAELEEKEMYRFRRLPLFPPLGDGADIDYKQRQKARMRVGKTRKNIADAQALLADGHIDEAFGELVSALKELAEAVEPIQEAAAHDAQIKSAKDAHPKPKGGPV